MTLQKQTVGVPLLGLNTLADQKSAAAGEFDLVENMWFARTARGGAELRKRYGGASLALTGAPSGVANPAVTSGLKLATFGNERLLLEADTLHSYSPLLGGWTGKGKISSVGVTLEHVTEVSAMGQLTGGAGYIAPDVAVSGNLQINVWVDTATNHDAFYAVFDRNTGERLTSDVLFVTAMSANSWVRVVALASSFALVVAKGNTNQILIETLAYSNLALGGGGATAVVADLNASCKGDVIRNGTNNEVLVAYHTTTPNLKAIIISAAKTLAGSNTAVQTPDQCVGFLHWDYSDGTADVAWVSSAGGGLKFLTITCATLGFSAATVADAALVAGAQVTGFRSGTTRSLFVEQRASPTYNTQVKSWDSTTGGAAAVWFRSVGLGARVFKVGSNTYYVTLAYESPLQNTYFVASVSGSAFPAAPQSPIIARSLYGLGGGLSATANIGQVQVMANGTTALVPVMRLTMKLGTTPFYGVAVANLDFSGGGISSPKRVGDNLHIPGGVIRAYAGEGPTTNFLGELGFFLFPETPTLTQNVGGSQTLLGTYQYVAVYAFTDAQGQIHRSAPSDIATITLTGANNKAFIDVPTLRVSAKSGLFGVGSGLNLTVEVYGTQASGTTFYRLLTQNANHPELDSTGTIGDGATDAAKGTTDILYTTGKVLPHIAPPAAKLMETWRNRLFLSGTENPLELWPSNEYSPGLGAVTFSDSLVITLESDGGPITALCEMDDRLVIFKRNAIYVLTGNGPVLTGDNQYQAPARLTATIGSVEQRGVVKTRDGVMFKSARGIHLLAHTGQIVYVGAGVDAFNALTLTGAAVLEDEEQVRFTTAEGRTLVYHYGFPDDQGVGRWTTYLNQAAVDCIMWNGKFAHLRTDGTVVEETVGAYVDPGATSINAKVRLCWLNLTQFFGRFRLYGLQLLGDLLATFTLTHRIAYDYDATVIESETKAVTVATPTPLQLNPARRRVVAAQVTLEETSTTEGFRVSGWGLEVGVEPGAAKAGLEKFLT